MPNVYVLKFDTRNQRIGKLVLITNLFKIDEYYPDKSPRWYGVLFTTNGELKNSMLSDDLIFDLLEYYQRKTIYTGLSGCADIEVLWTPLTREEFSKQSDEEMEKSMTHYTVYHITTSGYYELPPLLLTEEEYNRFLKEFPFIDFFFHAYTCSIEFK